MPRLCLALAVTAACGRLDFGAHVVGDGGDASDGRGPLHETYVKASNTDAFDQFGTAIALSSDGTTLAVGAPIEASDATGIDGDQTDNSTANAGAVYVFVRAGATWRQQAYVKASNTDTDDQFGASVALSADGSTLVVGAPFEASAATGIGGNQADNSAMSSGAVYVFTRADAAWSQQAYVKASNTEADDHFGSSAALAGDGNTLAVGAPLEDSNATGIGGNQADNSAINSGAVYVFMRAGTTWSQQAYVKASNTDAGDQLGYSTALAEDGNTLAIGANGESSAATGVDGDQADDTAAMAGAVYVLARVGATWSQQAYLKGTPSIAGDFFGAAVACSGNSVSVGVPGADFVANAGAFYVFVRTGLQWSQQAQLLAPNARANDQLGTAIALAGDELIVGAMLEDSGSPGLDGNESDSSMTDAGAAYVFVRAGATWSVLHYAKATAPSAGNNFGSSVAVASDGSSAVSAHFEDSSTTGIDSSPDENATDSGAAYVFSY